MFFPFSLLLLPQSEVAENSHEFIHTNYFVLGSLWIWMGVEQLEKWRRKIQMKMYKYYLYVLFWRESSINHVFIIHPLIH